MANGITSSNRTPKNKLIPRDALAKLHEGESYFDRKRTVTVNLLDFVEVDNALCQNVVQINEDLQQELR